jgi:hypothetical protein
MNDGNSGNSWAVGHQYGAPSNAALVFSYGNVGAEAVVAQVTSTGAGIFNGNLTVSGAGNSSIAGNVGIGSTSPRAVLDISQNTGAIILPIGTTTQRPTAVNGMIRYNTSIPDLEAYIGNYWTTLTTSSGSDNGISLGTSASVANPQRSGDPTTGLFSPAASTVAVSTGGTEAIRVNASQQVGIGSAIPATGMKADINGPVKVAGTGSEACTMSTLGAMRYNPSGNYMEICTYP